jgi:hypothetical protein
MKLFDIELERLTAKDTQKISAFLIFCLFLSFACGHFIGKQKLSGMIFLDAPFTNKQITTPASAIIIADDLKNIKEDPSISIEDFAAKYQSNQFKKTIINFKSPEFRLLAIMAIFALLVTLMWSPFSSVFLNHLRPQSH